MAHVQDQKKRLLKIIVCSIRQPPDSRRHRATENMVGGGGHLLRKSEGGCENQERRRSVSGFLSIMTLHHPVTFRNWRVDGVIGSLGLAWVMPVPFRLR